MLDNISLTEQFTDGFDATAFAQGSEDEQCRRALSGTNQRGGLGAVGNLLRHESDRVDIGTVVADD
jgi:hypothetical protein